jgi:hypothetical protein
MYATLLKKYDILKSKFYEKAEIKIWKEQEEHRNCCGQ